MFEINETFNNKKTESLFALMLLIFNFLFKITAAPFNFWAPSVYGKAPIASVTFISVFSKVSVFFAMVKIFATVFNQYYHIILSLMIFCGL
jgi:NADH-quinone oxidoreductase subunit N